MPYLVRKVPQSPFYMVMNEKTKRVYAKHTTQSKAEAQVRLLHAMEKKLPRPLPSSWYTP